MTAQGMIANDRLMFALFVAAIVHGFVILGIGFHVEQPESGDRSLMEVTLAVDRSSQQPDEDADFLAQATQEGSGTLEEAEQLATDQVADFQDNVIRDVEPMPVPASAPDQPLTQRLIASNGDSGWTVVQEPDPEPMPTDAMELMDTMETSMDIATLRALLDNRRQNYANRPRVRTLTSVSTRAAPEAEYVMAWQDRVERVGNANYPEIARADRLRGQVRLLTSIRQTGELISVTLLQSSGHTVLDEAARQTVLLSAPFEAFDDTMAQEYDTLEIIRTFRFEVDGPMTTGTP